MVRWQPQHALGNAGVFVAGAAVATTAVVGLYACKCNLVRAASACGTSAMYLHPQCDLSRVNHSFKQAVRVMMGSIYGLVLAAWLAYAVMVRS